ncbi:MAG TPA: hypothetical protein VEG62_04770 [Acidimicrobiales bacterium]|nr:hypothetical protein [Acidimicrobiales bacterium]
MCVMWQRRPLGEDQARSWERDDRATPRVLIESADGAEAHAAWRLLQREGYRTMWCPGPRSGPGAQCVLSQSGQCPLVDEADVVVSALDVRDPACACVVRDLDAVAKDKPVVVVAPVDKVAGLTGELGSARVVPGPLSATAVLGALDTSRSPSPSTS